MHRIFRAAICGALILAPVAASAQMVIGEPPVMAEEEMMVAPLPPMGGPLDEEGAAMIAMANGIATVEDVDHRFWDGNFEVEGTDVTGEDVELLIDGSTGAVLEVDD
jgi:hypothetical protein